MTEAEHYPAMPARLVLDQHLKLQAKLAGPDVALTRFLQLFSFNAYRKGREADLMFYPYRPFLGLEKFARQRGSEGPVPPEELVKSAQGAAEARRWATTVARGLLTARTFQVTSEMVDAVNGVYEKTMRKVDHLEEHELPAESGFVWLDKPLRHEDRHGQDIFIRALTWNVCTVRHGRKSGVAEVVPAIRIAVWSWIHDEFAPTINHPGREETDRLRQYLSTLGELSLTHAYVMPFGQRFPAFRDGDKVIDNTAAWLHVLWMFLDAEVTVTRKAQLDRHLVKRAKRQHLAQGEVNVVLLRRVKHLGTEAEPGSREVDWSCRWVVQGHWRHLDHYGQRHHAIPDRGPGSPRCLTCDGRITWIRAYLKGPDDRPLKATEQVWRLAR